MLSSFNFLNQMPHVCCFMNTNLAAMLYAYAWHSVFFILFPQVKHHFRYTFSWLFCVHANKSRERIPSSKHLYLQKICSVLTRSNLQWKTVLTQTPRCNLFSLFSFHVLLNKLLSIQWTDRTQGHMSGGETKAQTAMSHDIKTVQSHTGKWHSECQHKVDKPATLGYY